MIVTTIPTCAPQAAESPTDDELAHQALHDPEVFATLYHRYVRRVYNYLYGKVGQAEAEDLTAQVFTEVVEALPRYRPQGTFPAWLFTIARRRAADWFRHRRTWLPIEAAETQANTQADLLKQVRRNEETAFLRKCIQNLREDEIELLRLHFSAGLTYREMGVLGKSESAVGVSMHRLLRRLEADCEAENG
jgi:RNA polymerase sigma-70 factor (ECF subfamily)